MHATLEAFEAYFARIAPGLLLGAAVIYLARRAPLVRIGIYLALFVLMRDAMTPLGLWSFGSQGIFWIRLAGNPLFLVLSGAISLGIVLALYFFDGENRSVFRWRRGRLPAGLLWGLGGAIVVVVPLVAAYDFTPIDSRGGAVPRGQLPAMLAFALLGNLLEEALFRGYVYGRLAQTMTPMRAAVVSGVVFAFCHIYLAMTVTDVGYPLLAFTLWEGVIAGVVGAQGGVLCSTVTHGGAIFLLASGLI